MYGLDVFDSQSSSYMSLNLLCVDEMYDIVHLFQNKMVCGLDATNLSILILNSFEFYMCRGNVRSCQSGFVSELEIFDISMTYFLLINTV